jgi:threonine/homoserine/homoserine lactone efflux protein
MYMFDYSLAHWLTFFTAAILLTLSPGPDIAFILAQCAKRGRQAGFLAMYGIWTGAFFHVFLAAFGLTAILASSAVAFTLVKFAGAGYLIWLAIQSFRSQGVLSETKLPAKSSRNIFQQGMVVAALNPKTAIFFLSFLPQFVVAGAGPVGAQLFLHGSLVIAVAIFIEPPIIFAGAKLTNRISSNPHIGIWLDRGLGCLFVGLGLRLLLQEHT